MQIYFVDYKNGEVILPQILDRIFKISWVREPVTLNENDKKLGRYILWIYLIAQNYTRINIYCTPAFCQWMFSTSPEYAHLPGAVPVSHFLRLYAACFYPRLGEPSGELEKTWSVILSDFFYSRSTFFKRSNCHEDLTSFLFTPSTLDTGEGLLVIHEVLWRNDPGLAEQYDLTQNHLDRLAFVIVIAMNAEDPHLRHVAPETALFAEFLNTRSTILLSFFEARKPFLAKNIQPKSLEELLFAPSKLDTGEGLLVIHEAIWRNDPGLTEQYDLVHNRLDRLAYVFFMANNVDGAFPGNCIPDTVCDFWDSLSPYDTGEDFTLLHEAIWRQNANLHNEFPADREAWARRSFRKWLAQHLPFAFAFRQLAQIAGAGSEEVYEDKPGKDAQTTENNLRQGTLCRGATNSPGVTISGWIDGLLGIGEDNRTFAACCLSAGITHEVCCVSSLLPHGSASYEYSGPVVEYPSFGINITCLAVQDIYRLYLNTPPDWWTGRYNIGLCPWELPIWPSSAVFAVEMLDEIWAPSRFIAKAFAGCGKPVTYMPHAVIPPEPEGDLRKELGFEQDTIVFLTAFDANASCFRKNPFAVVKAFNAAFANTKYNVCLVVKTMNASNHAAAWQELIDMNRCGSKVMFIDAAYPVAKHVRLLNTCDAFVSLHRSEGFGRLLAEAMSLGKLLICSDFGGNTDFSTPETACLVEGKTVPVPEGTYILSREQVWYDVNSDHATALMKDFVNAPEKYTHLRAAGQQYVLGHHSCAAVGARALQVLKQNGLLL